MSVAVAAFNGPFSRADLDQRDHAFAPVSRELVVKPRPNLFYPISSHFPSPSLHKGAAAAVEIVPAAHWAFLAALVAQVIPFLFRDHFQSAAAVHTYGATFEAARAGRLDSAQAAVIN